MDGSVVKEIGMNLGKALIYYILLVFLVNLLYHSHEIRNINTDRHLKGYQLNRT